MPDHPTEQQLADLLREIVTGFIFHPDDLEITPQRHQSIIHIGWRANRADASRRTADQLD